MRPTGGKHEVKGTNMRQHKVLQQATQKVKEHRLETGQERRGKQNGVAGKREDGRRGYEVQRGTNVEDK